MNATLPALGGTVVADVPDRTWLLACMLAEEVFVAGVTNMIGTGDPANWPQQGIPGEVLAFPAPRRAPFGAAGPPDVTNFCAACLAGFSRTGHSGRVLAVGKSTGHDNGAKYFIKPCGHMAE